MNDYTFTLVSWSGKLGPIPSVKIQSDSCPVSCFYYNDCYGKFGPISWHWADMKGKKKHKNINHAQLEYSVYALPDYQLWRWAEVGDCPSDEPGSDKIDRPKMIGLAKANKGKRGFGFSHKYENPESLETLRIVNDMGLTINLSANDYIHADRLADTGLPTVCVLPSTAMEPHYKTPEGRDILTCRNSLDNSIKCINCGWCQQRDRKFIVGFPAHGAAKNRIDLKIVD